MDYAKKLRVYERFLRSHQVHTGGKIIGVRWVDVNKGDARDANYRSRLIGREFRRRQRGTPSNFERLKFEVIN